jgi:signal transduction histidine kinase
VSHDLKAPVRAIQTFAQFLDEEEASKLSPTGKDYLARIISSSRHLDKLITDVLAYSRMNVEPLAKTTVNVESTIQEIIDQNSDFQAPKAEIELVRPLQNIRGHAASFTQCMTNLLSNAVKFVRPGTTPHVKLWTQSVDDTVRLNLKDNGIGIAPEHQQRIFNAFERLDTEYEGTGFGLAIMRKAVERMGGRFGLESKPGEGSLFWIELPKAA